MNIGGPAPKKLLDAMLLLFSSVTFEELKKKLTFKPSQIPQEEGLLIPLLEFETKEKEKDKVQQ